MNPAAILQTFKAKTSSQSTKTSTKTSTAIHIWGVLFLICKISTAIKKSQNSVLLQMTGEGCCTLPIHLQRCCKEEGVKLPKQVRQAGGVIFTKAL